MPKNLVPEPFSVSLNSGMEQIFASEGDVTIFDFLSKCFCLTVPRNFIGRPFSAPLLSGAEKVWIREKGEYQDFGRKLFVSQC